MNFCFLVGFITTWLTGIIFGLTIIKDDRSDNPGQAIISLIYIEIFNINSMVHVHDPRGMYTS